jgi:hypothetical protein
VCDCTYHWSDREEVREWVDGITEICRVKTLIEGPAEEWELQWFDSEKAARAAAK